MISFQDSTTASSDEREFLAAANELRRLTITENPFIPWEPTEPQALFLTLPVQEAMYGGAAGGGKSIALLMAALQFVTQPGYSALLLRRTFADLNKPKALIPLSHEWLQGTAARWDGQQHQWHFPSGATLSFGYLDTENDKYQYQGAAYHFIGFDELTQFTQTQYRYLFSRKRRLLGSNVPTRVRSASNPGGVGHSWVYERFLGAVDMVKRVFVPAKMDDNPYLDREDYEMSLAELDPVTRAQLRHGDWNVRPEGNLFKRHWFDIIPRLPANIAKATRFWDLAATEESEGDDPDATAGVKVCRDATGVCYVADVKHFRGRPSEVERVIRQTAATDGHNTAIRIEQEPGSAGKALVSHYARDVLEGYDCRGVPSRGDKVTRAQAASAASERGDVKLIRGAWNEEFLDVLCAFPNVPHDDMVDGFSGAFNDITRGYGAWDAETIRGAFGRGGEPKEDPMTLIKKKLLAGRR